MKVKVFAIAAMMILTLFCFGGDVFSSASSKVVSANTTYADGSSVSSSVKIDYDSVDRNKECVVLLNGERLFSTNQQGSFVWQP